MLYLPENPTLIANSNSQSENSLKQNIYEEVGLAFDLYPLSVLSAIFCVLFLLPAAFRRIRIPSIIDVTLNDRDQKVCLVIALLFAMLPFYNYVFNKPSIRTRAEQLSKNCNKDPSKSIDKLFTYSKELSDPQNPIGEPSNLKPIYEEI
jgi:hypothetical protein